MELKNLGRILAVLGGLLLASSCLTWFIGAKSYVTVKLVLAVIFFAVFFITNRHHLGTTSAGKSSFFLGVTSVSTAVLIGLLVVLNYMAAKRPHSWDLTSEKIHRLSGDTEATLGALPGEVEATAFFRPDDAAYAPLKGLFEKYADANALFRFTFVDPVKNPLRAQEMNIRLDGPRVVLRSGDRESRFSEPTEEALTNALIQVTRRERKKVAFISGHGEARVGDIGPQGLSAVATRMKSEGLDAVELFLDKGPIPDDVSVAVVPGPRMMLDVSEIRALRSFILRAGSVLFLADPGYTEPLAGILSEFDLKVSPERISDAEHHLKGDSEDSPLIQNYNPNNPVTKRFAAVTVFPGLSPVQMIPKKPEDVTDGLELVLLAHTEANAEASAAPSLISAPPASPASQDAPENPSNNDSAQDDADGGSAQDESQAPSEQAAQTAPPAKADSGAGEAGDAGSAPAKTKGPFPVAAQVSGRLPPLQEGGPDREFKIVAVGDRDFATNGYSSLLGNEDFFLNIVNWLAGQPERITIRPRTRAASRLYMTPAQQARLTFLLIDLLPLTILAFGLVLWMIRRSK